MKESTTLLDSEGQVATAGVRVKTISVNYGRKVNLGDFNSANIEITVWADVEPEQDLHEACDALWQMAKNNVKAQILPLTSKQKAQVEELMLGLPIESREKMNGNHTEET